MLADCVLESSDVSGFTNMLDSVKDSEKALEWDEGWTFRETKPPI